MYIRSSITLIFLCEKGKFHVLQIDTGALEYILNFLNIFLLYPETWPILGSFQYKFLNDFSSLL